MVPEASKIFQFSGHAAAVYCLEQGQSNNSFFSGSGDHFVAEWNIGLLAPEKFSVKLEHSVYSLCFLKTQKILLIGDSAGGLHVLDLEAKKEVRHLIIHKNGIFCIRNIQSKGFIVSAGAEGSICILRSSDFKLMLQITLSSKKIRKIALNPDESLMAVADGEGMIRIFETEFFNELHTFFAHEGGTSSIAWHPYEKVLLSGGKDAHLRFWNTEKDFSLIREIPAHNFNIYDIVFSPNGQWCATASRDKTVKIWDANSFDIPLRLDRKNYMAHQNSVNCLHWCESSGHLISSGDDRLINIWEIK